VTAHGAGAMENVGIRVGPLLLYAGQAKLYCAYRCPVIEDCAWPVGGVLLAGFWDEVNEIDGLKIADTESPKLCSSRGYFR
jgi:hypothetical protein